MNRKDFIKKWLLRTGISITSAVAGNIMQNDIEEIKICSEILLIEFNLCG